MFKSKGKGKPKTQPQWPTDSTTDPGQDSSKQPESSSQLRQAPVTARDQARAANPQGAKVLIAGQPSQSHPKQPVASPRVENVRVDTDTTVFEDSFEAQKARYDAKMAAAEVERKRYLKENMPNPPAAAAKKGTGH